MDVNNIYLEGTLEEGLYLRVPEGLNEPDKMCRLQRGLYGLKQSGCVWNYAISDTFEHLGFVATHADPSMFRHRDRSLIKALYVNDLLLFAKDMNAIKWA